MTTAKATSAALLKTVPCIACAHVKATKFTQKKFRLSSERCRDDRRTSGINKAIGISPASKSTLFSPSASHPCSTHSKRDEVAHRRGRCGSFHTCAELPSRRHQLWEWTRSKALDTTRTAPARGHKQEPRLCLATLLRPMGACLSESFAGT